MSLFIEFHLIQNFAPSNLNRDDTDAIEPAGDGAVTICRYAGTNLSAGVAYSGNYKVCSFGFPFETIQSEKERNRLMESVLDFFNAKSAKLSYTKK
jgi:hypothetical protein